VKIKFWRFNLQLSHAWAIARSVNASGEARGSSTFKVALLELEDDDGVIGYGEAAPSSRYEENVDSCLAFFEHIDASQLRFQDVPASMAYLEGIAPKNYAAKGAVNIALLDGAGKHSGKPIYDLLKLGFSENKHVTSFSIGIDKPFVWMRTKGGKQRRRLSNNSSGSPLMGMWSLWSNRCQPRRRSKICSGSKNALPCPLWLMNPSSLPGM
jgi:hypothetical protein